MRTLAAHLMNWNKVILLIGSNQGKPSEQLALACRQIATNIGDIVAVSQLHRTQAWGNTTQQAFLNQAVEIRTPFSPLMCLNKALAIEKSMGRTRNIKWEPRIIDIDIIFYNRQIINLPQLKVPHPHVQDRKFALACLAQIIPGYKHPVLNKSINKLLKNTTDTLEAVAI
jgi:2-amino-4-hydroxy-6-hydroxymethyldihydropteridine diphosphokinase